jgi:hypothetical protein
MTLAASTPNVLPSKVNACTSLLSSMALTTSAAVKTTVNLQGNNYRIPY